MSIGHPAPSDATRVAGLRSRIVLVTRPEPDAQDTARRLAALGFVPLFAPALRIEPRTLALPSRFQAILVTSGNAVPALDPGLHATPLLAVGDATAARARAAGFWRVSSAGRDAAALSALVPLCCDPAGLPLLLASGAGQGMTLAHALRRRGYRVLRRVAYATRAERSLPGEVLAALQAGAVGGALFFSPASASAFVACCREAGLVRGIRAAAISVATAAALSPLPWADIRVASHPNQDELLACLT